MPWWDRVSTNTHLEKLAQGENYADFGFGLINWKPYREVTLKWTAETNLTTTLQQEINLIKEVLND
jgi:hypothetical protein